MAIGLDGHIYLADKTLRSIVRINGSTGAALPAPGQTGAVFVGPGSAAIGASPKIAFDPAGNLNVASDLDGVARFSRISGLLLGTAPTGLKQFSSLDIAFDVQGRLYRSVDGGRVSVSLQGEPSALTDANGNYSFSGLEPGTYTVVERVPSNAVQTFDLSQAPVIPVDINPGATGSTPTGFIIFNNLLYFSANGDGAGQELWRFDGKTVTRITDINPGLADSFPSNLIVFDNALYFTASDATFGTELWRYDGATATRIDINPNAGSSAPSNLVIFNNALYFQASEPTFGTELWRVVGTTASRITDINPGAGSSFPFNLTVYNGALYFGAQDAGTAGTFGREVWRYDGSTLARISDINPGPGTSNPSNLLAFGGFLYFSAQDSFAVGTFGNELYRYNGSTVSRVTDISPGIGSSSPTNLTPFNGSLYFTAFNATFGTELYQYTNPTLTRVTDINPGSGSSTPLFLTSFNNALYFSAQDAGTTGTFGRELWRYDGTAVARITDINAGTLSSTPSNLIVFDDALYFAATDQNTVGNELWRYDGAVTLAADINPGFPFSSPQEPIIFDGSLFMRATGATQGEELWRYTLRRQVGAQTVVLPAGQGAANRDFGDFRVVDIGADRRTTESTLVSFPATVNDPNPATPSTFSYQWQAIKDNGPTPFATGTSPTFTFTPTDDGDYLVALTVTDSADAKTYREQAHMYVANVAPTLEAGVNFTLNEGQTLNRPLTFADPGSDTWTAAIDYGDGSSPVSLALTSRAFTLSHLYTDSGLFTVVVRVGDDDGGTVSDSFQVTSNNLPPTASAGVDQTGAEGTPVTLAATVSDPGTSDTFTYLWSVAATNGQIVPVTSASTLTFTPTDQGTYTVTLTVTDDDGAAVSDQAVITVTNVVPSVPLLGAATVLEGSPYTMVLGPVTDPGTDTVTQYRVNWGDGSSVQLFTPTQLAAINRTLTHTYANGTVARTITVDLVDEEGTYVNAGTLALTVQNVGPVLTGLARSATVLNENGTLTLSGTFTDPGTQDAFTVAINWGDGSAAQQLVRPSGSIDFSTTHQYRDDNPTGTASDVYPITVTVSDGSATSAPSSTSLTVQNVAPAFAGLTLSGTALTEGASLTVSGGITDVGTLDTDTVTVNWGDGTAPELLTLSPTKTFSRAHLYTIPGSYTVTTTARDDDGGAVTDTRLLVVADLAPAITPSTPSTVQEGARFTASGSFTDLTGPEDRWTATVRYDSGPVLPLPLTLNKTFTLEHIFTDNSPHTATVTVADTFGLTDTEVYAIDVQNVAPTLELGANATVDVNSRFLRTITFTDPGQDTWTDVINYGDGSSPISLALTSRVFTLDHLYTAPGAYPVTVQLTDDNGGSITDSLTVQAVVPGALPLGVTQFQPTATGFRVSFTQPLTLTGLNLYDVELGSLGLADVTLIGTLTGPVRGSLVLDATGQQATFIKTGGPLLPDTYTVALRSGLTGLRDLNGGLLDGNQAAGAGDPYLAAFVVAPTAAPSISLPDFARGPGQVVNLPATGSGIPIRISDGRTVESVDLTFTYDPALLTITGVTPSATLPAGALVQPNLTIPGTVRITIASPTPLNPGAQDLVYLQASVPGTAAYGAKQILDLTTVTINEQLAVGDDAVQVVAYVGDATGNGSYSLLDAQRLLRVTVGLDSGFTPFPLLDPVVLSDITGNGTLTGLDATRLLQEVIGLDRPEIPALPPGILVTQAGGIDPVLSMPTALTGSPGETITVPITIDNATGVEALRLQLQYNTTLLDTSLTKVRLGTVTTTNPLDPQDQTLTLFLVDDATGTLDLSILSTKPRTGGGSLVTIDFTIAGTAADGPTAIDLTGALLEGGTQPFILTPPPVPGPDGTDGRLNILRFLLDVDGNGQADALSDGIVIIRHLFGFTGNALVNGVVDPNGTRNTAPLIEDYLQRSGPVMLDVDGNGQADALSDGIVMIRYLFGFTGNALINGVVDPAGTRNTAAAIEAFLSGFLPVSSPSVQAQSIVASAPVAASAATTTTTASDATSQVVPLVEMERDPTSATTATVTDSNYGQAYVQHAWVKEFVNGSVVTNDEEVEDELVIQLQEPVLV